MRREHQQKKFLHEIRDIYLETIYIENMNDQAPIIEKIAQIIEKLNDPNIYANKKLLQWSKMKFGKKVMAKVIAEIVIRKVEIFCLVNNLGTVVKKGNTLFNKLCDVSFLKRNFRPV